MYTIEGQKVTLTRGDTFKVEVGMKSSVDGSPYTPVEGDVIKFGLKKYPEDEELLVTKTIPNNTRLLHLAPADTASLDFGRYHYDIEITLENGDKDTFINNQEFWIAPEVV